MIREDLRLLLKTMGWLERVESFLRMVDWDGD